MNCIECNGKMVKSKVKYKGFSFDALKCTKCGMDVFTEQQATAMARTLDAARMKQDYEKKPLQIGRSWGMTFPKEVAEVFGLNSKEKTIRIHTDLAKNKIELEIIP